MPAINKRITVAQEAQEFIEMGSGSIDSSIPSRVLVYLARKYVESLERTAARAATRGIEREVSRLVRRTPEEIDADVARSARRKAWAAVLGLAFTLGDGSRATWGDATRAQHEARSRRQRMIAESSMQDAQLHDIALADLARFGVNSLAEL